MSRLATPYTLILTISLCCCGKLNTDVKSHEEPTITPGMDTSVIAIFSYDTIKYRWYNSVFKDGIPTVLTNAELLKIDTLLNTCINDYNPSQELEYSKYKAQSKIDTPLYKRDKKHFLIFLYRYKRQYLPIINARGEKEVWINCFCTPNGTEKWRSEIISVEDGGNCFFNIKLNLTTGQFYAFSVNNDA